MTNAWRLLLSLILALCISCFPLLHAYAQTAAMKEPTTGKSLDVLLRIGSFSVQPNEETKFSITFLQHGTNNVQPFVDYYFKILKDGKQVFRVPSEQPVLHTPDGNVSVFYRFDSGGNYTVQVTVAGIAFQPIRPETASFPVQVAPEFPSAVVALAAAAVLAMIVGVKKPSKCL